MAGTQARRGLPVRGMPPLMRLALQAHAGAPAQGPTRLLPWFSGAGTHGLSGSQGKELRRTPAAYHAP